MYLLKRQQKKLFCIHNFLKVLKGKFVRSLVKLPARMSVCKVPDSKTVGGVELPHEELAAGLPHRGHLEDGGGGEEHLDIVLADRELARVGEVH